MSSGKTRISSPFLYFFALVSLSLIQCASGGDPSSGLSVPHPNVLLILTDDLGYGDVANSGNPYLQTPHLDQLAAESVRFRYFYVSPVCAPTRASLMTGRYHQRTGVRSVTNGYEVMQPDEFTLAEMLKEQGYRTAIFGKWHLGEYYPSLPDAQGFDEYLGFRTGHTNDYFDAVLEHNGRPEATEGYITDVLTEEAIRFMAAEDDRPFFCYLAYNAPHTPLQIDSVWFEKYLAQGLEEKTARVYGMVENIDANIGKLREFLKDSDLAGNTIIVFLSDNGPINGWRVPQSEMRYNAGLRDQKFTVYEGGIRTQSYWHWPDKWPAREITRGLGAHIDLVPTLADILHLPTSANKPLDGISLQALLKGDSASLQRTFFQNFDLATLGEPAPFPGGIAIDAGWKMVNGEELYYLPDDTGEHANLAATHPERLEALKTRYLAWWKDVHQERGFEPPPIPAGYAEENPLYIRPHHGHATGKLQFQGWKGLLGDSKGFHPTGVDGDWITNWQEAGDQIQWSVEIINEGIYRLGIEVRGLADADSYTLRLQAGDQAAEHSLPALTNEILWTAIPLAELVLAKGVITVHVQLVSKRSSGSLDMNALVVELL